MRAGMLASTPARMLARTLALWAWMLGGTAALAVMAAPAGAAQQDSAFARRMRVDVEFGWGGMLVAERWSPLWITLTPPPGASTTSGGAVAGLLTITYAQDASQQTQIVQEVTSTPGRSTTLCVPVCLPAFASKISIEFMPFGGPLKPTLIDFDRMGDDADPFHQKFRQLNTSEEPAIAVVGSTYNIPESAMAQWMGAQPQATWNAGARIMNVRKERLPTMPSAYDALGVLIVEGGLADQLDPRALASVRHWVAAGGRLVIVANQPGEGWRQWFGPQDEALPIRVDGATDETLPPDVIGVLGRRAKTLEPWLRKPASTADVINPDGTVQPSEVITVPEASLETGNEAVESVVAILKSSQRCMTLTNAGTQGGWTLRWLKQAEAGESARGLIAEGPVGLGLVTVVGVLPSRMTEVVNTASLSAAWEDVLKFANQDRRAVPLTGAGTSYSMYYGWDGSGGSAVECESIRSALEASAVVSSLPAAVILTLLGAMGALVLFIGPVDYIMLGRVRRATGGLRHKSHLTAALWIGVASTAAYFGPQFVRSGKTLVTRVSAIDVVQEGKGAGQRTIAAESSLTGIWSGATKGTYIEDAAAAEGTSTPDGEANARPALGVWRGVSPLSGYGGGDGIGAAKMTFGCRPAMVAADNTLTGGYARGSEGTLTFLPEAGGLFLQAWTFRAYMDNGTPAWPVTVSIKDSGGAMSVRLDGVPKGATLGACGMRAPGLAGWQRLKFADTGGRAFEATAEADAVEAVDEPGRINGVGAGSGRDLPGIGKVKKELKDGREPGWVESTFAGPQVIEGLLDRGTNQYAYRRGTAPLQFSMLHLGPAERRAASHSARLASGRFAVVYLTLENVPLDVRLHNVAGAAHTRTIVARVAVPIGVAGGFSSGTAGPSGFEPSGVESRSGGGKESP